MRKFCILLLFVFLLWFSLGGGIFGILSFLFWCQVFWFWSSLRWLGGGVSISVVHIWSKQHVCLISCLLKSAFLSSFWFISTITETALTLINHLQAFYVFVYWRMWALFPMIACDTIWRRHSSLILFRSRRSHFGYGSTSWAFERLHPNAAHALISAEIRRFALLILNW